MEEQTVAYTRIVGKTAFVIGLKQTDKAERTLEEKLERMLLKKAREPPAPLSSSSE